MPELPDIQVYLTALEPRVLNRSLIAIRVGNPFLLRSVDPPLAAAEGCRVEELRRLGKRLVFGLDNNLFLVLHLMIAGRLRWQPAGAKLPGRSGLAAFDFADGTLVLTEAGSKRRASLYLVRGEAALADHDRGGLEVLEADIDQFRRRLTLERHTLKRSLTDPRLFSGIGNAYSDEILHRAKLSPFKLSSDLSEEDSATLFAATCEVMREWIERLQEELGDRFPDKVTAFRPEMAVHGRFGKPCPVCAAPVQRIVYAETEANYCAGCQTGGKILADRMLSRLLKDDWPRRLEDLEK
jgi:formamidopyrimidine-DNA glycosylase